MVFDMNDSRPQRLSLGYAREEGYNSRHKRGTTRRSSEAGPESSAVHCTRFSCGVAYNHPSAAILSPLQHAAAGATLHPQPPGPHNFQT
jgi:hypothetical protein